METTYSEPKPNRLSNLEFMPTRQIAVLARDGRFDIKPPISPEFKIWFGESKAKSESGAPEIFFHGTVRNYHAVDLNEVGMGIHFGTLDQAIQLARSEASDNKTKVARIIPCYLKVINPIDFGDLHYWSYDSVRKELNRLGKMEGIKKIKYDLKSAWTILKETIDDAILDIHDDRFALNWQHLARSLIKDLGFDAVRYKNEFEPSGTSYLVLDPNNCKSIFAKKFDLKSQDIYS